MGDEADLEMVEACDSKSELQIKPGIRASIPANGELSNGDPPAASQEAVVVEVKDLEGLATTSCASSRAPNIKGITYCQLFSLLLVTTNRSHTADRNYFCGSNSRTAVYLQHTRWQFVHYIHRGSTT